MSSAKAQDISNPGLKHQRSIAAHQKSAGLKAEVERLAAKVAALELKLSSKGSDKADAAATTSEEMASIAELVQSLQSLTAVVDDTPPTSARLIGSGGRPATAPYRRLPTDSQSVVSWSADAFGKSKTPGWYHVHRKDVYNQRAARAATQPDGCYVSHSKYADEAVRIAATGRLAFSAGK